MEFARAFFASGHAADLILAVLAAEYAWLLWRGGRALDVALALGPAVLIILALRGRWDFAWISNMRSLWRRSSGSRGWRPRA